MPLPRPVGPAALWADIRTFARERSRVQWIAAVFAILMPLAIVVTFYYDSQTNIAPGEQVIMVESWSADRTDEEIKAAQAERQKRAEEAARIRQQQYEELEKRFGM